MNATAASKNLDAPSPASSRERMIEAAIALLRATGLTGAGINQVIAASGAPKGSMYHHFPGGKLELAAVALQRWGEQVASKLRGQMSGPAPLPEKIRALYEGTARAMAQSGYTRSCSIGAVSLDLDEASAPLAPVCARVFASWRALLVEAMGEIPEARREPLARFIISSLQGAQLQARAARDNSCLIEAGQFAAELVGSAMPPRGGTRA